MNTPTARCGIADPHGAHRFLETHGPMNGRPRFCAGNLNVIEAKPAVIWCRYCPEPATGDDELCDPHRAGVPAAITDPWLAREFMRKALARR